jgi:glycosyltransferase involved in cell wall biosynthesis
MNNPLISILMPTFKDSDTISESIRSLLMQDYSKWELIIINDLFDKTDDIINSFRDKRIKYLHSPTIGQLNALLEGASQISGDLVTILHSDDLFASPSSLKDCVYCFFESSYDGIYSDLIVIDKNGDETGLFQTAPLVDRHLISNVFLLRGSNIVSDFFFVTKDAFDKVVLQNYVSWNMPYWFVENKNFVVYDQDTFPKCDLKSDANLLLLRLKKVKPWYKYRVYSSNYILSDVGKFEAFNGMLRTTLALSKYCDELPFSRFPWVTEYLIKKWNFSLSLNRPYYGSYLRLVNSVYESVYGKEYNCNNVYISSILSFYMNFSSDVCLPIPENLIRDCRCWYRGCDARKFYSDISDKGTIDPLYEYILGNTYKGFSKIQIKNPQDILQMQNVLKFLNLIASVEVLNTTVSN